MEVTRHLMKCQNWVVYIFVRIFFLCSIKGVASKVETDSKIGWYDLNVNCLTHKSDSKVTFEATSTTTIFELNQD